MEQEVELSNSQEMVIMVADHAKRIIESLLFATREPLSAARIREILHKFFEFTTADVITLIHELRTDYLESKRAFRIEEVAEGYMLLTAEDYGEYVHELYRDRKGERLSQAAREVLAIIALKGPITRSQIEKIRGVDSSNVVLALVERELVETKGQLEAPGRPSLYGVTETFLQHFGLKDSEDLKSFFESN
ncbi:MAG: SMC-Scp complex subunit ScpB [Chlamydiia bacterium]|nr:SMC-Scp complex subunit ScpB [Chlamydiia bacterium]